jgi:hypothetical protein
MIILKKMNRRKNMNKSILKKRQKKRKLKNLENLKNLQKKNKKPKVEVQD